MYNYFSAIFLLCIATVSAQEKYFRDNDQNIKNENKLGTIVFPRSNYTYDQIKGLERRTPYRMVSMSLDEVSRFGFIKEVVSSVVYYSVENNGVVIHPKEKWLIQVFEGKATHYPKYTTPNKESYPDYYFVSDGTKWGIVTSNGQLTVPVQFDNVTTYSDEIAKVKVDKVGGFYNIKTGALIDMYDVFEQKGDEVLVRRNGKYGLVNNFGNEILPLKFDNIQVNEQHIIAQSENQYYAFTRKGKQLLDKPAKSIRDYCDTNLIVEQNDKFAIYSIKGELLTSTMYDLIKEDGQAFILTDNNSHKKGCLDCNGNEMLPVRYTIDAVNDCSTKTITKILVDEGTFTGDGIYEYPNGVYEGSFVNGVRHGYGKMRFNDGKEFLGNWKDDARNGRGKLFFPDGNSYVEGTFVNGLAEGYATFRYCMPGQSIGCRLMKGNFRDGKPIGEFSYEQGTWLTGYNRGTIYFDENGKSTLNLTERDFLSNAGSSSSSSRNNTSSQPKEKEPTNADCEAKYRSEFYKIKSRVKSKFSQKISNEKTKYEVEVPSPKGGTLHFSAIQLTNSFGTFWREENYYGVPVGNVMYKTLDDLIYAKYIYEACQFYTENNRTTY